MGHSRFTAEMTGDQKRNDAPRTHDLIDSLGIGSSDMNESLRAGSFPW